MTQAAPAPNGSWADASANWADAIGNNAARETPKPEAESEPAPGGETSSLMAEKAPAEGDLAYGLELPEGMAADSRLLEEFASLARESNIPPAAARKILDLEVRNVQRQMDAFSNQQNAWREEINADPEFGGRRIDDTVNYARRALKTYDPSGTLLPELNRTGYGNHPGIIRFLARVGRTLREDNAFSSRAHNPAEEIPLRDRLWPS